MWPLKLLLPELVQRLGDVARQELIPLIEIEGNKESNRRIGNRKIIAGVRRARAVQLYDAGYKTVAQVAAASYIEIIQKIGPMRKAQAMQIIRSAKVIFFYNFIIFYKGRELTFGLFCFLSIEKK